MTIQKSTPIFETFADALIAAHRHSRMVECGYAFAVKWPLGHCTVEFRKPSLRDQRMKVICCADGRMLIRLTHTGTRC